MRPIRLPQIQNVGPNQRASLRFPLGVTYEKLYFYLAGNILNSLITNIVLRINNKEFQRWNSLADMMSGLSGYKGSYIGSTQFFVIDFTERLAREEAGMKMGTVAATQEAGVQEFTMEFDLGTYTATGGSVITAYADVEAASANRLLQRVQVQQRVIAAAAQEQIFVPSGANGYQVKRLIIKHANLSSLRIRRDGTDQWDDLTVAQTNLRAQDFGRTPQAGYCVIDLMPDSLQSNALNTALTIGADGKPVAVQNLDIRVTTSAADTLTIYTESYSLNNQL